MTVHGEYTGIVRDHPAIASTSLPAEAVDDVESADAGTSEYTSAEAGLINELKKQLNALLASLRAAGILAESE